MISLRTLAPVLAAALIPCVCASQPWPHSIPCRLQDGANPDLFVMTLGDVETPLAQGSFDPVKDEVTLTDGTRKSHYYRDTLGVKFYQPIDKSRFPLPPSGWCTWYFYYHDINAAEVLRNAEWIATNLKDYGAQYVQIDDGWQGTGAKGSARNWEAIDTKHFPNGLESITSRIKELGLTSGLWIAPHGQNNDDVVKAHPGLFLRKPDGATASDTWEGRFLVDPTAPDAPAYFRSMFQRLSGFGFDYFKIDGQPVVMDEYRKKKEFMHQPAGNAAELYRLTLDAIPIVVDEYGKKKELMPKSADNVAELYRSTLDAIREGIGPDRYLVGCWGTPLEGAGIMNGSRTGGDIVLGWGGFRIALRATLRYYYLHNIVWYSDPDVLLVRSPLTIEQARAWATLQGLTGQALMSSDRLMDLGPERVELLRRVFPATDNRPLDLFHTDRDKRIWDLKVGHLSRKYDVVGVFNFGTDKAEQIVLNWQDLGLPESGLVHVFDFWNKEYLGAWPAGMAVSVAPTSCRVLTLLPDNGKPQLISTSRHITQGPVDLVKLSGTDDAFQGTSHVVKGDPYRLSFAFPRGKNLAIARATARASGAALPVTIANHQGWATAEFTSPATQDVEWNVSFGPGESYDFTPSEPNNLVVRCDGLTGVVLNWNEQFSLNCGYQVYLDGKLLGATPETRFPIRSLDSRKTYTVTVTAVWENGQESKPSKPLTFRVASLAPDSLSLDELEPIRSTGGWSGHQIEDLFAPVALAVAGKSYAHGMNSSANSQADYAIDGLYDTFAVTVGIGDGSQDAGASAEFLVLGDGKELWRSGSLKRGDAPKHAVVALPGVRTLTLKSVGDKSLQADWLEPKLVSPSAK